MNDQAKAELLSIARRSLEAALHGRPAPEFEVAEPELEEKRGCFVTLKTDDRLRGCLGQFTSDLPLYQLVARMTASSALEDPRFAGDRIAPEELDKVRIDISVLSPMEKSDDPMNDIELGTHGIYIKKGFQSGCFLPQVATETGWSKEEFLGHCCTHKAGLPWDGWKDPDTDVYIFTAEVFEG
jgi:AmmeMemoRadiSam system protein A